jgi:tetratricopeptide (TPR) repeat protein
MSPDNLREIEAIYLEGRSSTAYIPYARALREAKAFAKALEVCLRGLENDSDSLTGRLLLSEIYMDMGRYDSALGALSQAESLAPHSYRVNLMLLRVLLKRRDFQRALEILESLKQEYPFDKELMRIRATITDELEKESTSHDSESKPKETHTIRLRDRLNSLSNALKEEKCVCDFLISELGEKGSVARKSHLLTPRLKVLRELAQQLSAEFARLGRGLLRHGVVETEKGYVLLYIFEPRFLAIVTDSSANLGKLRYTIESLLSDNV